MLTLVSKTERNLTGKHKGGCDIGDYSVHGLVSHPLHSKVRDIAQSASHAKALEYPPILNLSDSGLCFIHQENGAVASSHPRLLPKGIIRPCPPPLNSLPSVLTRLSMTQRHQWWEIHRVLRP